MRRFRHYGCESFDPEKFDAVKNRPRYCKPLGGLWASPIEEDRNDGWAEWCKAEGFHTDYLNKYFEFTLREDARVAVIDTIHNLEVLLYKYPQPQTPGKEYMERVLDFEKMCENYDAIELTSRGQWDTRLSDPNLYGWDCHSLLVLNPNVVVPVVNGEHA